MDSFDWTVEDKTFRFEKTIVPNTDKEFIDMPTVLKVSGNPDSENWHKEVLTFLHSLKDCGTLTDWNQVAFLFRSVRNEKVVALAEALEEQDIPVYSPRSNLFFDRIEIRLMIGALIFLFRQFPEARKWNKDASLKIWEYYDDECFKEFTDELRKPENELLRAWCSRRAKEHLHLSESTDYAFTGLFYELLQFPLFSQYLGDLTKGGAIDSRPARNLAIFSQLLSKFEYLHRVDILLPKFLNKNLQDLFNRFFRFLKEGGIDEYEDASEYAPSGCVSFMTIHQSKGLEFPIVVVGSMEAIPRKQYTDLDELLQENYYSKPCLLYTSPSPRDS